MKETEMFDNDQVPAETVSDDTESDNGKILVIDDDAMLREFLNKCLTKAGYQVTTARDGAEGIRSLKKARFDLVICDVFMPEADGLEVLQQTRKLEAKPTPILMVSGGSPNMTDDFLRIAGVMGATSTLPKPFNSRDLLNAVAELLQRNRHQSCV